MHDKVAGHSGTGVEAAVMHLHQQGVEAGRQAGEEIKAKLVAEGHAALAEAKEQARVIKEEAEAEARRITEAAEANAAQIADNAMLALPEMVGQRAVEYLGELIERVFDPTQPSDSVASVMRAMSQGGSSALQSLIDVHQPETLLESIILMATATYASGEGAAVFDVDQNLKTALAQVAAALGEDKVILNFAPGIEGVQFVRSDGGRVTVSPQSVRHMALHWTTEEFRSVYAGLLQQEV